MATPRTSRRQLARLAFVLRAVVDDIAAAGGPVREPHRQALALVDAFVRGKRIADAAWRDAAAAVKAANARYGVHSPPLPKALHWVPLETLIGMARTGDDHSALVLSHAGYAGSQARIDELLMAADGPAAVFPDAPLAAKTKRVSAATKEKETAGLARVHGALHPDVAALLARLGAAHDPALVTARPTLESRLARAGYSASDAIAAFDATFGGLLIAATTTVDAWREQRVYTLVGAGACVGSGWTSAPRGGADREDDLLVPVALGAQDDVYFLDPWGKPHFHETIGARNAVPFGKDGADLVTRLVLWNALMFDASAGPCEDWDAEIAAVEAGARGLVLVSEDDQSRWWLGPNDIIVVRPEGVWARRRGKA